MLAVFKCLEVLLLFSPLCFRWYFSIKTLADKNGSALVNIIFTYIKGAICDRMAQYNCVRYDKNGLWILYVDNI